ncbi:Isoflavone reductase-like protein [Rhynchospora pubera]|uniref:Isoflavone reductase-like protein n=1 Tax=Rhynchospora pubera TaxID=906938 RepID=A0AAV8GSH9_9POAL|nr:Isoflavone reductase-like protein [Rhynchospora pubera]
MATVDGKRTKILVIGGTGNFGRYVVDASIHANYPTFVLTRPPAADDTEKKDLLEYFVSLGVELIFGSIHDYEILLEAVKKVDVIISALGHEPAQLGGQTKILKAIMEAGNIKRFIPSEFGTDAERVDPVEPAKTAFMIKAQIRQMTRNYGIPHTIICSNFFQSFFLPRLGQAEVSPPIQGKVNIIGDGDTQAIYVNERDVAAYVIKAANDPRTLNKILYVRPSKNSYSLNQLVALWEKKTGKTLKKKYITEEQLLAKISCSPIPLSLQLSIAYSAYIKGEQTNFNIDPSNGVEATELYPEIDYITVEEFMNGCLL